MSLARFGARSASASEVKAVVTASGPDYSLDTAGLDWDDLGGFSEFVRVDHFLRKTNFGRGRASVRSQRPGVAILRLGEVCIRFQARNLDDTGTSPRHFPASFLGWARRWRGLRIAYRPPASGFGLLGVGQR